MGRYPFSENIRIRVLKSLVAATGILFIVFGLYVQFGGSPTSELVTASGQNRGPAAIPPVFSPLCKDAYRAICGRRGAVRDPTGTVHKDSYGEIRALRIYEEIVRQHPDWTSAEIDEELVRKIYTPERRKKFEEIVGWVQRALAGFVERQPETVFSADQKSIIVGRLMRTVLQFPPPAELYKDEPDLFTKNDVFYERPIEGSEQGQQRLRIGGAYFFTAKSRFNVIFTVAHELAHAIDPCEIRAEPVAPAVLEAYQRLNGCFIDQKLVANPRFRKECGSNDQSSETFADWVAVHVMVRALEEFAVGYSSQDLANAITNSVRDLCDQDDSVDELDFEFHPTPRVRIERIFGRNPEIRELIGCPAPTGRELASEYCRFTPAR